MDAHSVREVQYEKLVMNYTSIEEEQTSQNETATTPPPNINVHEKSDEIHKYQKSTGFLIPKARFQRLCREMASEMRDWYAFEALQEVAESFLVNHFEYFILAAFHANA
ncbi:hypothetical protein PsorP6_007714 [Peronosclerospora sorghi]|uniref:Uncharacterized protein n=1 Tax=Peronosclerospora sorghi TaxID=230839 RepID=A0ACC0WCX8_9STRA|nr:hypothetical protein PsorP6_007714 [Peronosclerospora sorghi]